MLDADLGESPALRLKVLALLWCVALNDEEKAENLVKLVNPPE